MGAREKALAEASHGAAMIVLPVPMLMHFGAYLPSWSPWAAAALMIWGGFLLNNGAKFSVGWRDPKLIARASIKIVLGLLAFRGHDYPALVLTLLALLGWWLCVTGITKLILVLRGLPALPQPPPKPPYGTAGFSKPHDPGWKL
jgi:hypothetical protein